MKIAIILPPKYRFCALYPNSIETVIRTLAGGNLAHDEIIVFCEPGAKQRCDIPVIEIDSRAGRRKRNRDIIAALKVFDPDFIEFHQSAATLRPIAKAFKYKATAFYRHNYVKRPKGLFSHQRLLSRMKYFRSTIMVSNALRDQFLADFPGYRGKVYTVQNAIDPDGWLADVEAKENLILFAGRAAPEKGVAPLAEALARVLSENRDWRAVLMLNDYNKHAQWANGALSVLDPVKDRISLMQDQKLGAVKAQARLAAISVIPSMWKEPFGLVALEAHASGCAVISSGSGGLREASNNHAIYLPEVSANAIEDALLGLIRDKQGRMAMGRAGQDYVRTHHNLEVRSKEIRLVRIEAVTQLRDDLIRRREAFQAQRKVAPYPLRHRQGVDGSLRPPLP